MNGHAAPVRTPARIMRVYARAYAPARGGAR
jgi:hypothetical protein